LLYVGGLDDYITISSDFQGWFGGVVHVKVSKLILAAFVAAAGLIGFAGVAQAGPAPSSAVVACVNGDGVMSLTITNPAADAGAEFVITNPQTFVASAIDLAPGASQVVTLAGLPDGSVVVPVQVNGNDASVTSQISCDPPVCTEGVLSVVTDQSGVQHQACVASAAEAPVAPVTPVRASLAPLTARTGSANAQSVLPTTGAGTGGLVIAAVLVGSGSVVSLFSRRKRGGSRKGFRRRGLTP
jgi:LPXTG-motif cell wall-anchored protein